MSKLADTLRAPAMVFYAYTADDGEILRQSADALDACERALRLALEYWAHRQQRYKNRAPAWVIAAREALAKLEDAQ